MKNYKMMEVKLTLKGQVIDEITVAENDVYRIFSIYANKKLTDRIEDIIKVDLPTRADSATVALAKGIEVDGIRYVFLATTTGLMKHADMEESLKGEVFFIKEKYKSFVSVFKDIISLGKMAEKVDTELCINKDITSRISLAFSDGDRVHTPGLKKAILPEMTYKFVNNYLQFAEKDGHIDLEDLRLEEHKDLELEHIAMDGCGFIMPNAINTIGNALNKGNLSWIGIREIGTASKGLLVSFDFKQYLREEHGLNELLTKDMWGNTINIFEYDVVMNESMCKWAKWFKSQDEIDGLINDRNYKEYKHLFEGFNIVKTSNSKIKTHTESNYQIIANLAITPGGLDTIAKETEESYRNVTNKDIDAIRIALGDVARENQEVLSATTKVHKLLQLDEKLVNIKSSKKVIESLVNKKINTLAGGSIALKGGYKTMCHDALGYMDMLAGKGSRVLDPKIVYIPKEFGNRVLARCPLNSATEMVKVDIADNKLYKKYFGNLGEDVIFIPFDDTAMIMSGADFDLDITFAIDDEIIYNAVIEDIDSNGVKWNFRNQFDGDSVKEVFNLQNYVKSIIRARGNAIGKLSNKGITISNMIQEVSEGATDEEVKESILNKFQEYKKYSYFTLYLQMKAIDSVKTNVNVTKEEENVLKEITQGLRKPRFVYYAKYKAENKTVKYSDTAYTSTVLNNYCKRVISELGFKARELENSSFNNRYLHAHLKNVNVELNETLYNDLKNVINEYHANRNNLEVNSAINNTKNKMKIVTEGSDLYMSLKDELSRLCEIRNREFDLIDIDTAAKYKDVVSGYSAKEVLRALGEYKHNTYFVSPRFVMEFAFDELVSYLQEIKEDSVKIYKEDADGDIRYMFKNYLKVNIDISEESLVEKSMMNRKKKLGLVNDFRFGELTHNELTEYVTVEKGRLYNELCEELGKVYIKKDGTKLEDGMYLVDRYDFATKANALGEYKLAKSGAIYVNIA